MNCKRERKKIYKNVLQKEEKYRIPVKEKREKMMNCKRDRKKVQKRRKVQDSDERKNEVSSIINEKNKKESFSCSVDHRI